MAFLWNAFLEDFDQEIWDWTLRETLEAFWCYCEYGSREVREWAKRRTATEWAKQKVEEEKNETSNAESF